jgi:hypothetical protein
MVAVPKELDDDEDRRQLIFQRFKFEQEDLHVDEWCEKTGEAYFEGSDMSTFLPAI